MNKLTVVELRKLAKAKGVKGYSSMRKANLVSVLEPPVKPVDPETLYIVYQYTEGDSKFNDNYIFHTILGVFKNRKDAQRRRREVIKKHQRYMSDQKIKTKTEKLDDGELVRVKTSGSNKSKRYTSVVFEVTEIEVDKPVEFIQSWYLTK